MVFVVREKEYEQAMNFMVESKFKFIDFFLRSLKIAFLKKKTFYLWCIIVLP